MVFIARYLCTVYHVNGMTKVIINRLLLMVNRRNVNVNNCVVSCYCLFVITSVHLPGETMGLSHTLAVIAILIHNN